MVNLQKESKKKTDQRNILFLPKWYPHKFDLFEGNFIQNHAIAVSKSCRVNVLFVHSEEKTGSSYEVIEEQKDTLNEIRIFYKKPMSKSRIYNAVLGFFRYYKAQRKGYRYIYKSYQPDIVHVHVLTRAAILALHLKLFKKIPFVITEHWSGYLPESSAYQGILKKILTRFVVKKSSAVTTVSTKLADAMKGHKLNNNYYRIPNVVDTNLFQPIQESNNNQRKQIIYIGNLIQPHKKIFDIIHAMNVLKRNYSDFVLNLYGEGQDEDASKELVRSLELSNYINFHGSVSKNDIAKKIAQSDFLILFSEYENQPCVLNEAWACGIPVIAPNIAGISEDMNPDLGIMIPVNDQSQFQDALEKMLYQYQTFQSSKIRDFAVKNYSEEMIGQQFSELYEKICS